LTIVAIITGPILAIQIQVYLEKEREQRRRKVWVFRELMVTRAMVVSPRHVEALNGIQMEFSSQSPTEKAVIDAWQNYLNHLNNPVDSVDWKVQSTRLLAELLVQMATCLGYHDFNEARIKSESYIPQYLSDMEAEQNALRKAAVEVFKGDRPLKVSVIQDADRGGFQAGEPWVRRP
jgi:hypothetical protein